jgi:RAB protein geranylgeranyltransferase component A
MRVYVRVRERACVQCLSTHRSLARAGLSVLHLERNAHYGGAESTFSLPELHRYVHARDTPSILRQLGVLLVPSGC